MTCKYSAYDVIKTIRKASGGITDTRYLDEMADDKESFRELIQNERRLELAFENHLKQHIRSVASLHCFSIYIQMKV